MATRTGETRHSFRTKLETAHGRLIPTPLVDVTPPGARGYSILAKIEALAPGLSVKDRVARHLVAGALSSWSAPQQPVLVEASSGNTGVSVAMIAHEVGLRARIFVPGGAGAARIARMRSFGAEVVLTPQEEGTGGARKRAVDSLRGQSRYLYLDQHGSELNVDAHRRSTGPELLGQLAGRQPDFVVLAVGTGGTLLGLGEVLRDRFPSVGLTGAVPAKGSVIPGMRQAFEEGLPLHERLRGFDLVEVDADEAARWASRIRQMTGIPTGPSSGAAMAAACRAGRRSGGLIVTLFPDHGFNYS